MSIADDSGIAAVALGGAPGVRSARYAGEHASDEQNLAKLMREAPAGSALEYVCMIAYVDPARELERTFEGRCAGRLAEQRAASAASAMTRRSSRMTGRRVCTMAQLSDAQKDAISHRGRAARALLAWLAA